jgi:predicted GNAT family N-acyltransferase
MERSLQFTVHAVRWCDAQVMLAAVREAVFIREQRVPAELEWDGLDADSAHVLAQTLDGTAIGTARLLPDGHIGRMAVLKDWRGKGVGSTLLRVLLERASKQGHAEVRLNSQLTAQGFYAKHGFVVAGEEFMDAGIPHIEMVLRIRP